MQENKYESELKNVVKFKGPSAQDTEKLLLLFQHERYLDVIAAAKKLTLRYPLHGLGWAMLGAAYMRTNAFSDAAATMKKGAALIPADHGMHYNLGLALHELGSLDEAEASFRRAIRLQPDFADVYSSLGRTLHQLKRFVEAERCYAQAILLKPGFADAYYNLGNTLRDLERIDEAVASYRTSLEMRPDFPRGHSNLIFAMDLSEHESVSSLQDERKKWGQMHAANIPRARAYSNLRDPNKRLRIGYVSGDFREHSAVRVFEHMLLCFDREQFEVYAYFNGIKEDAVTQPLKQSVTAWRGVAMLTDDAMAELIQQDQIDILVDLSGHSAGDRLLVFARKPAPIQITAWGYATATGLDAIDVFFADRVTVPEDERALYVEEVRYLPCIAAYSWSESLPPVTVLPAKRGTGVTFGSFNRLCKISDPALALWAQVLLAYPGSTLLLKTRELDELDARERICARFSRLGISADRLQFMGGTDRTAHLAAFGSVDICLDPFPHGGGVSTLESLLMGVPVVTLRWKTIVGRLSASFMTALGLEDWVACDEGEYLRIVNEKLSDLERLEILRRELRDRFFSSCLGDVRSYVQGVEEEYRTLWKCWVDTA